MFHVFPFSSYDEDDPFDINVMNTLKKGQPLRKSEMRKNENSKVRKYTKFPSIEKFKCGVGSVLFFENIFKY